MFYLLKDFSFFNQCYKVPLQWSLWLIFSKEHTSHSLELSENKQNMIAVQISNFFEIKLDKVFTIFNFAKKISFEKNLYIILTIEKLILTTKISWTTESYLLFYFLKQT